MATRIAIVDIRRQQAAAENVADAGYIHKPMKEDVETEPWVQVHGCLSAHCGSSLRVVDDRQVRLSQSDFDESHKIPVALAGFRRLQRRVESGLRVDAQVRFLALRLSCDCCDSHSETK